LAVALGLPTLTLFGSTDPRGWQPPGQLHRALFDAQLSCRPCDLKLCPVAGHPCLDALMPSSVLVEAKALLHAARERGATQ
jgi:heptosyltransferase-2